MVRSGLMLENVCVSPVFKARKDGKGQGDQFRWDTANPSTSNSTVVSTSNHKHTRAVNSLILARSHCS